MASFSAYCVLPTASRGHPSVLEVHERGLSIDVPDPTTSTTDGSRIRHFPFTTVLSTLHPFHERVMDPLFEALEEQQNIALLFAAAPPPISLLKVSPQMRAGTVLDGEANVPLQLLSSLLPALVNAVTSLTTDTANCSVTMCEVFVSDGRSGTVAARDLLYTPIPAGYGQAAGQASAIVSNVAELTEVQIPAANMPGGGAPLAALWEEIMDVFRLERFTPAPTVNGNYHRNRAYLSATDLAVSNPSASALLVTVKLNNWSSILIGDLGYNQQLLHLASMALKQDTGLHGSHSLRPPKGSILTSLLTPFATTQGGRGAQSPFITEAQPAWAYRTSVVCVPNLVTQLPESLRQLHFASTLVSGPIDDSARELPSTMHQESSPPNRAPPSIPVPAKLPLPPPEGARGILLSAHHFHTAANVDGKRALLAADVSSRPIRAVDESVPRRGVDATYRRQRAETGADEWRSELLVDYRLEEERRRGNGITMGMAAAQGQQQRQQLSTQLERLAAEPSPPRAQGRTTTPTLSALRPSQSIAQGLVATPNKTLTSRTNNSLPRGTNEGKPVITRTQSPTSSKRLPTPEEARPQSQRRLEAISEAQQELKASITVNNDLQHVISQLRSQLLATSSHLATDSRRQAAMAKTPSPPPSHINSPPTIPNTLATPALADLTSIIDTLYARIGDMEVMYDKDVATLQSLQKENALLLKENVLLRHKDEEQAKMVKDLQKKDTLRIRQNALERIYHITGDEDSNKPPSAATNAAMKELAAADRRIGNLEKENKVLKRRLGMTVRDEDSHSSLKRSVSVGAGRRSDSVSTSKEAGDEHPPSALFDAIKSNLGVQTKEGSKIAAYLDAERRAMRDEAERGRAALQKAIEERDALQLRLKAGPSAPVPSDHVKAVSSSLQGGCENLLAKLSVAEAKIKEREFVAQIGKADAVGPRRNSSAAPSSPALLAIVQHRDAVERLLASIKDIMNRSSSGTTSVSATASIDDADALTYYLSFEVERLQALRAFVPTFTHLAGAVEQLRSLS